MGENIYKFRKDKKLSQEQLAEVVGVSRQTISNWELNETVPDANQLLALSKALGVSVDKLLNNEIAEEVKKESENDKNYIALEKIMEIEKGRVENRLKWAGCSLGMWIVALIVAVIIIIIGSIGGNSNILFFMGMFFFATMAFFNVLTMSVRIRKLQKEYKELKTKNG